MSNFTAGGSGGSPYRTANTYRPDGEPRRADMFVMYEPELDQSRTKQNGGGA